MPLELVPIDNLRKNGERTADDADTRGWIGVT